MSDEVRKFPRILHVPFSPGVSSDDKVAKRSELESIVGIPLIVTEKMDGSNVCLTRDDCFARSHASAPTHASFDMLKALHADIRFDIPKDVHVFGEWLYAVHSIKYDDLPSYLMIFGARQGDIWWSWEDVREVANELRVPTVPALFQNLKCRNIHELDCIVSIAKYTFRSDLPRWDREGVVVRPLGEFADADFSKKVFKWVRSNHVQTDQHWRDKPIERNGLKGS